MVRAVLRLSAFSLFGLSVWAASPQAARAQAFEERLPLCLTCHGEKGQSETPEIPSLGAQPPMYVLIQLYMFRENLRQALPMNDMAAGLSDADLQRFGDTMNKLPAPPPAGTPDPAQAQQARALIGAHQCGSCHNADFSGTESVPRLAGQREDYLLNSLRGYKNGTRIEYQPVMAEVVRPLKDEDFVVLAHYLARTGK